MVNRSMTLRAFAELLIVPNILAIIVSIVYTAQLMRLDKLIAGELLASLFVLVVDCIVAVSFAQIFLYIKGRSHHISISFFSNSCLLFGVTLVGLVQVAFYFDEARANFKYYCAWGLYLLPNLLFFYKARREQKTEQAKTAVTVFN